MCRWKGACCSPTSGKFTKGIPKYVMMLDGIEVEFPPVDSQCSILTDFRAVRGGVGPP